MNFDNQFNKLLETKLIVSWNNNFFNFWVVKHGHSKKKNSTNI